jgi:transcriptional regulator with XRE-family HTH domain
MRLDGSKVREARDQARLTQAELSIAVGQLGAGVFLSQTRISQIETGRDSEVNELEATVLAAVLTRPLSAILVPDDMPARAKQAAKLLSEAQALLSGQPGQGQEERSR